MGLGGSWLPYANGGFIIFDNADFGALWLETAREIDKLKGFPSFRPWLDQVSLTIAAYRNHLPFDILDMKWNDTPMLHSKENTIMHYHKIKWMRAYKINKLLIEIVAECSGFESIGDLFRSYQDQQP